MNLKPKSIVFHHPQLSGDSMTQFATCISQFMCMLVLGGFATVAASGQASADSGRLEGHVLDPSGALLPDAEITVTNVATGAVGAEHTDSKGHFEFLALAPGHYRVRFTDQGFGTTSLNDVIVRVGTTTNVEPHLQVGTAETQVSITSEALVDTQQSSLSTVINRQSIDSLPLNGRNFTDFTLLTPGATTDGQGMVSFNGVAGNFNNYSVDGGNNNNAFFSQQIGRTTVPFQFSEDVIQEFQVTNSGFEVQFGRAGGGLVNTVTRSGANQLHGDAYYFILDSAFNANDPINKQIGIAKPSNRRQQFGGTLGGPIKHDRIFYLVNYEGQIRNQPITVNNSAATTGLLADFSTRTRRLPPR